MSQRIGMKCYRKLADKNGLYLPTLQNQNSTWLQKIDKTIQNLR